MRAGEIDTDRRVLIVAEIGNNHEGDPALAEHLIGLAVEAGADAVKFQTYRTEAFVSPADRSRFDRLRSFELSWAQFERLSRVARSAGLLFISTPLDLATGALCQRERKRPFSRFCRCLSCQPTVRYSSGCTSLACARWARWQRCPAWRSCASSAPKQARCTTWLAA